MSLADMLRSDGGVLARFTRDLTAEARAGRLEPIRCRDEEIARLMDILLRQGKNNPALVGPAGVGKTAIAEGLAQRIAAGEVPLALRDVRLLSLDHVALLAGTTYRGQYEERIRGLVEEVTAAGDAILFIDELHNLIGQGTALGVSMDAANMLKPALVRGEFRVIGATTEDEYERWILGDPALERRFQKITVRELGVPETLEILRARRRGLERHHNVVVADEAIEAAVRLTDLHVTDRTRPDRAIDALDEACAHAQAGARYTSATEALIRERRELLRRPGGGEPRREREAPRERAGAPAGTAQDPLDRFARDGMAALERFGAELEAVFAGGTPRRDARAAADHTATPASAPAPRPRAATARAARLAELDVELERRLMDEGLVVRGHDVARVVALMAGSPVTWSA